VYFHDNRKSKHTSSAAHAHGTAERSFLQLICHRRNVQRQNESVGSTIYDQVINDHVSLER
jgi:hypothetical protein